MVRCLFLLLFTFSLVTAKSIVNTPFLFPDSFFSAAMTWQRIASQNTPIRYSYSSPRHIQVYVEAEMKYHPRFKLFNYEYSFQNGPTSDAKLLYLGVEKRAVCTNIRGPNGFQEIKKNSWRCFLWRALPTYNPSTITSNIVMDGDTTSIPNLSYGIKPAENIRHFRLSSYFLPDIVKIYARPYRWLVSHDQKKTITPPINDAFMGFSIGPADNYKTLSRQAFLDQLARSHRQIMDLHWIHDQALNTRIIDLLDLLREDTVRVHTQVKTCRQLIMDLNDLQSTNAMENEAFILIKNRFNYVLDTYL